VHDYPLLSQDAILREAKYNQSQGILRYSVVASGRVLTDAEVDEICMSYRTVRENCPIALCGSLGLLTYNQFVKLKAAGVTRYHNNLETSRRYFPSICTTHTYDDKIATLTAARQAGLELCSGGIMGLGETMEDRIDMALDLRGLGVESVPVNILNPIKGTPLEHQPVLSNDELRRIIAIYRFIMPHSFLRLAGGRGLLPDKGRSAFLSGANATISGNMLTTSGISVKDDMQMLSELGFEVRLL
jgi:biotin synthase